MYARFLKELAAAGLPSAPADEAAVTDADLEGLPDAAARNLRFMRVVGRPRDWSFRARFTGRFRRQPGQRWLPCEAWQYNTALEVACIFHMSVRIGGVVPMIGRDTYLRGRGRMHGKLLDLITVVDGQGAEFDTGELIVYLNDLILLAPSMLLRLDTTWSAVDEESFDVTLRDAGHSVTGRVFIDEQGAVRDFATMDKYAAFSGRLTRTRWTTPVSGWETYDGRPLPLTASASFDLPEGPFPYAEGRFLPASITYNVAPGPDVERLSKRNSRLEAERSAR